MGRRYAIVRAGRDGLDDRTDTTQHTIVLLKLCTSYVFLLKASKLKKAHIFRHFSWIVAKFNTSYYKRNLLADLWPTWR